MTLVKRAWKAWVELLDRRESPTSLALVRLLAAAVVLADLFIARGLGLVDAVWAPPPYGLGVGALSAHPPLAVRWLGATPHTAELVWLVTAVAAVLVLVGAATRVAAIVFVLASAQLALLSPDADRGIDVLLRVVFLILALSGCGARWSIDALVRRRVGRPAPDTVPAWPRYLLFLQMVWLYFSAAQSKGDPAWGPFGHFAALGTILCDPHFARLGSGWVASAYPLTQLATASTMLFEWGSPALLVFTALGWQRARAAYLLLGAAFHVGIALTMRLGIFPFGVLALYPVFFHPDELARVAKRGRSLLSRRGSTA
jgi:uncharacterized membrane protein YphA (DoxX/SURF4 family)